MTVPEAQEGDEVEASGQKHASRPSGNAGRPSGPAGERPEELVPNLIQFLKGHPHLRSVPKVVQVRKCCHDLFLTQFAYRTDTACCSPVYPKQRHVYTPLLLIYMMLL